MDMVRFFCPECGKAIEVGDNLAGTNAFCPHCAARITIPQPDDEQVVDASVTQQESDRPNLQLRSNKPAPNKSCPKCQASCAADAVICVGCGTDLRTGRQLGGPATPREPYLPLRNLRRFAIPLSIASILLLGCICWGISMVKDHFRAQELAERTAGIESEYSALTSRVSRSVTDIDGVYSDMQTLSGKAASLKLTDWSSRCEEYAGKIETRRNGLITELLSLSNSLVSLEAKGDFGAAVKLMREYKGAYVVETEDFRRKYAAMDEVKAAQHEFELRKVVQEQQRVERERQKVADAVRAEKEAAEKELIQHKLREDAYAKQRSQIIKSFVSPIGKTRVASAAGFSQVAGKPHTTKPLWP